MALDLSRRINAERIVVLGWTRAILLQLAHPLVAAGVARHSTFRGGARAAVSRLHGTIGAMLAIAFGDARERERALDGIREIHRRVNGTLTTACGPFPAGTRYSAEDAELLLWVHATLIDSVALTYDRLVAPLSDSERDQYCAEGASVAIELGANDRLVPREWASLQAYLEGMYATRTITVCTEARELAAAVLSPFSRPLATPVSAMTTLLTTGLLPAHIRRAYDLPWTSRRDRAFTAAMEMLRVTRAVLPRRVAWWPQARTLLSGTPPPSAR